MLCCFAVLFKEQNNPLLSHRQPSSVVLLWGILTQLNRDSERIPRSLLQGNLQKA